MVVNRRLLLLVGLLAVAIVVFVVVKSADSPAPAAAPSRAPAVDRTAASRDTSPPADVKLAVLEHERAEPIDQGRNPFRFKPKPPPPPPPAPPRSFKAPDSPADGPNASVPAGPPPPPPISLKFIGIVQKTDGTKIAVLTDGKRPIHGKEGEEIEGRYKILRIGEQSIDIAYIDGRGRRTIALTGK